MRKAQRQGLVRQHWKAAGSVNMMNQDEYARE